MSYVEKAFWDYLKSTLFGGIRILLSRQLILFSLILVIISAITTSLVFMKEQVSTIITPELVQLAFTVQLSLAIGLIIAGLISKRLNLLARFLLMISLVVGVLAIFLISSDILTFFTDYIPLITFFCWSFLIPIASFSFAKGMFSNKVTGSILFLGKPRNERKSIFSGLITLIAIFSVIGNGIIIYEGLINTRISYTIIGGIGLISSIFIIFIVHGFLFSDDVFNTVLGLFFVMSLPNQIMIVLTSISGSANIITSFDFILLSFALLYSAQNISRRIKMKGVIVDESGEAIDPKKDDPYRIGRFIGIVGGEGIVLIYLGLALGFHLVNLQVINETAGFLDNIWKPLFGELSFSEAYHDITSIFAFVILIIVTSTYIIQRGRGYWEADIIRFDFLPPYDDLKDYMEKVKTGEISKTDIALTVGKKVGKTAVDVGSAGIFSAAKMFRDRIFKGSDEDSE